MTQKVTHFEPMLTVAVKMASEMGDLDTTNGKECTNAGFQGSEMKSIVKWDVDALTLETKGKFGDNDFTMKDKWTLSPDGKALTINRRFASSMGELDQKIVLEKQ